MGVAYIHQNVDRTSVHYMTRTDPLATLGGCYEPSGATQGLVNFPRPSRGALGKPSHVLLSQLVWLG